MLAEKIKSTKAVLIKPESKRLLSFSAYFLLGFAFGSGRVLSSLHPFCASIVAVSGRKYFLFSGAGALFGIMLGGVNAYSFRYVGAVCISALGVLITAAVKAEKSPFPSVVSAFFSTLVTGLVLNFSLGEGSPAYLLLLGESILSAGGAYFFNRALSSDYKRLRFRALPLTDVSCIVISSALFLMTLSGFKILSVTPARVIAVCASLCALRFFGERWGLVFALSLGFASSLEKGEMLFIVGAFAFSVMTASLFSSLSHFVSAAVFVISSAFFCIASESADSFGLFLDSLTGALAFVLLPPALTEKLEALSENTLDSPPDGSLRQSLVLKLRFAGAAMEAISESVEQVSERIDEITRGENESLKDKISAEEYASRELILEKTNQLRRVASDQFFSISDMLGDLAFEFDKAEIFDSSASSKIRALLSEYAVYPDSVSVVEDKYSRIRVEILLGSYSPVLESAVIKNEIGKICSRYFEDGIITNFKDETMLSFSERANYRLEIGFAQHSADGHLCGDTIKIINDSRGHSILIISDGMGKGSRAALDGAMGAGLLSKLVNAGFGFDCALRVVNSALLVKSNDESLATLDIANIDLFTGRCEIMKSGAPASYIIKGENITKCELFSMPAGILRGIEFAKRTAVLTLGDLVVLMSDGITEIGEEELLSLLKKAALLPSQEGADYILEKALEGYNSPRPDDMSVIVARLKKN